MKIVIDVANYPNSFKQNDILVYDGKGFVLKSYNELFNELELRYSHDYAKFCQKYEDLEKKWKQFMTDYTDQNSKLLPILKAILEKKEG